MSRKKKNKKLLFVFIPVMIFIALLIWCIFFPKQAYFPEKFINCSNFCCVLNKVIFSKLGMSPICVGFENAVFSDFTNGGGGGLVSVDDESIFRDIIPLEDEVIEDTVPATESVTTTTIAEDVFNEPCQDYCDEKGYDYGMRITPRDPDMTYESHDCIDSGGTVYRDAVNWLVFYNYDCCCINPSNFGFASGFNDYSDKSGWCWDTDGGREYYDRGVCFEGGQLSGAWGDIMGDSCETINGVEGLYEYYCTEDESSYQFANCYQVFIQCDCVNGICVEPPVTTTTSTTTTIIEETTTTTIASCNSCVYENCDIGGCKEMSYYIGMCEQLDWYGMTDTGMEQVEKCVCNYYSIKFPDWAGGAESTVPTSATPCYLAEPPSQGYCPKHAHFNGVCTYVGGENVCKYG